ncbi:MAG: FHA domain-containing protein [Myxococcota bacterium]
MSRFELLLPGGGPAVPLAETPVTVGRGPANGVVLADDGVSWHHAQLWVEGDTVWLRDLGSRNGTFVNGDRTVASTRLRDGDEVRIGAVVALRVRAVSGGALAGLRTRYVEDLATGARVLVRSDRFLLGSAPGCDLRIDDWPARAVTILLHPDGEVWVGTEDGEEPIEIGVPFAVRGRSLRVVEDVTDHAPTVEFGSHRYPYRLHAAANVAGGPQVTLADPSSGRELVLTGNRGVLLYALARQAVRDREAGLGDAEAGWCSTDDALIAVWGRGQKDANHLNVLVHRLRGHLTDEGFDPWFVEKRRGGIRVKVREVSVE